MTEFEQKMQAVQALLAEKDLDGLFLKKASSFAWATCGEESYVNLASSFGEASLLIARERHSLFTNTIEAPRLKAKPALEEQGWEFVMEAWEGEKPQQKQALQGLRLGADTAQAGMLDLENETAALRANLTTPEQARFRELGRRSAQAMQAAMAALQPGMRGVEIAGRLAKESYDRDMQPVVALVALDEEIYQFRHPLPSNKSLEKYVMVVLCARWKGLVASLTRLAYFGRLPEELRLKSQATAEVDAAFIQATRPGQSLAEVFAAGKLAYAQAGFAQEWKLHHQGGAAGYEPREAVANPGSTFQVRSGQVYAWNPSITGTKSEDSVLIGAQGAEVLTAVEDWPLFANGRPRIREM